MNILQQLRDILIQNGITLREARQTHASKVHGAEDQQLIDRALTLLWQTKDADEDEIARSLYGASAGRKTNAYKKIKQRLTDSLTGELIAIGLNAPHFNATQRGYYTANRDYVVASILNGRGAKRAARYFYRRALTKGAKHGAYQIKMLALVELRNLAANLDKSLRDFNHYNRLYQISVREVMANEEIAGYYLRLIVMYDGSPAMMEKIHDQAIDYLNVLDQKYELGEFGYRYDYIYFQIKLFSQYAVGRYQEGIAVNTEAIAYFRSLSANYPLQLATFYQSNALFYGILRQTMAGTEAYRRALDLVLPNSSAWINVQRSGFVLFMYGRTYARANELCEQVITTNAFSSLPNHLRERWLTNQAYLRLLTLLGVTNLPEEQPFRLGRFLNSVPVTSKQKEGNYIPVVIIRILFLIHSGKHQEAEERIDQTEKYLVRYLRRRENYRSKCFIKILQQFAKGGFRSGPGRKRTKVWYGKLQATPLTSSSQSYEIEVVPYEDLYAIMMQLPLPFLEDS